EGVQKEAQAGKRTTLEVLNSQQDLMQARARLIAAQQDRVVASYTLLGAIGRLDRVHLALNSPDYDPPVHYQQVRDAWHGMRTPSGQGGCKIMQPAVQGLLRRSVKDVSPYAFFLDRVTPSTTATTCAPRCRCGCRRTGHPPPSR